MTTRPADVTRDRCVGALVGLAVGDALGAPLEFSARGSLPKVEDMIGGGPFGLRPGEWTDDTSMALCLAEHLLECGQVVPATLAKTWLAWRQSGYNSCTGVCFDIGTQTSAALSGWQAGRAPPVTDGAGNGGVMRLAPSFILGHRSLDDAIALCTTQSAVTHNSRDCQAGATAMATALNWCVQEGSASPPRWLPASLAEAEASAVSSTGYVWDTVNAALWAAGNQPSFETALIAAVNLGEDSDTVGAVTGQIAGAMHGLSAIPERWLARLAWRDRIVDLANQLYEAALRR